MIVKESGQYDKETMQRIRLENLTIHRICNLEQCVSLVELSLAQNEVLLQNYPLSLLYQYRTDEMI